jgi:hypothetical protein
MALGVEARQAERHVEAEDRGAAAGRRDQARGETVRRTGPRRRACRPAARAVAARDGDPALARVGGPVRVRGQGGVREERAQGW